MRFCFITWIVCFFLLSQSFAQTSQDSSREKRVKIIPFPAFGYAPETRWYAGAVALITAKLYPDSVTRKTSFKTEINITQNKQQIFTLSYQFYFRENKFQLTGDNGYYKFPEDFWGFGIHAPEEARENYQARRIEIDNSFLFRLFPGLYSGPRYRYQNMYNITAIEGGIIDGITEENEQYISSGAGYKIIYDTRDNIFNSSKGAFLTYSGLFFSEFTGSDFNFYRHEVDLRGYRNIGKSKIIAVQASGIFVSEQAPFRMLALLGSDNLMRGYYPGRYRDQNLIGAQAEFRMPVYKFLGIAAFAGSGTVFKNPEQLKFENLLPSYGGGIRIRVDKKDNINLRFDYGIGKDADGFYVSFGEAF